MEMITLKECLDVIHSGEKFSIVFVTSDKARKTGGEILEYENCVLSAKKNERDLPQFNTSNFSSKRHNHYVNATRNIELPNGKIRKIHIWLIIYLNGKKVTLY